MARILLVDDEPGMGETLRDILEDEGHEVSLALDGGEALRQVEEDPALDLVLLDMRLPDMGGVELLLSLRSRRPQLLAAAISGYEAEEWGEEPPPDGLLAWFTKPVDIPRLLELIREAVPS